MSAELKEILNSPPLLKLVAQNAFQTMDVDNNGFIDFGEFQEMIKEMATSLNVAQPMKIELERAFSEIDRDKDKRIGFEEFQFMVKEIIRMMAGDS